MIRISPQALWLCLPAGPRRCKSICLSALSIALCLSSKTLKSSSYSPPINVKSSLAASLSPCHRLWSRRASRPSITALHPFVWTGGRTCVLSFCMSVPVEPPVVGSEHRLCWRGKIIGTSVSSPLAEAVCQGGI